MKLVVINGSPRGKKSNSNTIISWFENTLKDVMEIKVFYALMADTHQAAVDSIEDNDTILIIFPLYIDSVPYVLKAFIEEMDRIAQKKQHVKIYYVVQSGFNGAYHCRNVEKYLEYLAKYMGFEYMGTAIRPSSEGLRNTPPTMLENTILAFQDLALDVSKSTPFNSNSLSKLISFEKPGLLFKFLILIGLGNTYFKSQLKKNGRYKDRYYGPYQ